MQISFDFCELINFMENPGGITGKLVLQEVVNNCLSLIAEENLHLLTDFLEANIQMRGLTMNCCKHFHGN